MFTVNLLAWLVRFCPEMETQRDTQTKTGETAREPSPEIFFHSSGPAANSCRKSLYMTYLFPLSLVL